MARGPNPGRELGRQSYDPASLERLFGSSDVLPLWIAEPDMALAPQIVSALESRAASGWYGYEIRRDDLVEAFWAWMQLRQGWNGSSLHTAVSPSVGTSVGTLIDILSEPGDGVIIQTPVFTDFKTLVSHGQRQVIKNPLKLSQGDHGGRYEFDLDHLAQVASDPTTKVLILCSPHNPVGRVWSAGELAAVADVCAQHDVSVIADEIHADIVLGENRFTPFATVATATGVRWVATHGPIKTFGMAGVCDTLLITDDDEIAEAFGERSNRFHLTRNNVFALAAFEAAYRDGGPWFDEFLGLIEANVARLAAGLPDPLKLAPVEGTYLAWLDLRGLDLEVPELTSWLSDKARLATSPGHWFGREGAGFARITVAVEPEIIDETIARLSAAIG